MPKIIGDARRQILLAARRTLFAEGYSGLSLRGVAQDCSIAVGTIYNYFKDKDTLIASVMFEDWEKTLAQMDEVCAAAPSAEEGLAGIEQALRQFAQLYTSVWEQFSRAGGSSGVVSSRHQMLRGQISQRISALLDRLGYEDAVLAPLLAETVLAAALQPDIGPEQIRRLARRMQ